ncbi:MAG: hypothetical protein VST71_09640 [Nitrospirota bacterium]|nr:hypothetical protein [Nitrospirota bacterium]
MRELFLEMIELMDSALQDYVGALPPPAKVNIGPGWVYRFENKDIHHAVVLKLVFVLSSLRAAMTLLDHGYVCQQAALHRLIDEANEDILFLVYAVTNDKITDLHQRYLGAFWAEEFADHSDLTGSHESRPMIPRKKIRAYLAQIEGHPMDVSRASTLAKVMSKTYSGFVHGAAPHIMELYGGNPGRFHTNGMVGTPRIEEYANDLWNYLYRGLLSLIFAAKMFGSQEHVDLLVTRKKQFEQAMGKDYGP